MATSLDIWLFFGFFFFFNSLKADFPEIKQLNGLHSV